MRVHRASGNDIPLAVLNNQSLNQVFVGGQLLSNPNFDNGTTGWTIGGAGATLTVNDGIATFTTLNASNGIGHALITTTPSQTTTNSYLVYIKYKPLSLSFGSVGYFNGSTNISVRNANTFTLNTWHEFSYIYTSGANGRTVLSNVIYSNSTTNTSHEIDYIYLYNLTSLGIATLTKSQLDYLFQVWQFNNLNALVARQFIQEA
jgi:hypothetical protein